jgi:hypothetical protein
MVPVVFVEEPGGDFWADWHSFVKRRLLGKKLISPHDLSLYRVTDKIEDAVAEFQQFYRVYHSMRYVKNKLVFRLTSPISEELLDAINAEFADILVEGKFTVSGPLPEEQDEPDLEKHTRLVMRFNRRDLGRLRQLIDALNLGKVEPRST